MGNISNKYVISNDKLIFNIAFNIIVNVGKYHLKRVPLIIIVGIPN